jgi:hypothetical protein
MKNVSRADVASCRVGSLPAKTSSLSHRHISQCSEHRTCEVWSRLDSVFERKGCHQVTGITLGGPWRQLGLVPRISPIVTGTVLAVGVVATPKIIISPIVLVTPSVGRVPSTATSSPTTSLSTTIVTQLWCGTLAASGIPAWGSIRSVRRSSP